MTKRKAKKSKKKPVRDVPPLVFGCFVPGDYSSDSGSSAKSMQTVEQNDGPLEPVTSLYAETRQNAAFFKEKLGTYKPNPRTKVLTKASGRRQVALSAHKLRNRRFVRPEYYRDFADGGILREGNFADFIEILKKEPGLHDNLKNEFEAVAKSESIKASLLDGMNDAIAESGVSDAVRDALTAICTKVLDGRSRQAGFRKFGTFGLVCTFADARRLAIEPRAGFIGEGDRGVLSAVTGRLFACIELKLEEVKGGWIDFRTAQTLFNEGFGFMVGRNCDVLILVNKKNYMLIWRVWLRDNVYRYFKFPSTKYARFDNPAHLERFQGLLGELARISAYIPGKEEPEPEEVVSQRLQNRAQDEPGSDDEGNGSGKDDATEETSSRCGSFVPDACNVCKDKVWLAETKAGLVELGSMDLDYHLTDEQLLRLAYWEKPPKDDD